MPVGERRIRFGPFQLDTQCGQLRKNGIGLKLQGQPVQILEILLEKPGELVTREELRQRLWSTDTFVDFDHSLNTAIKRLRQALGEDAETPKYIETIPKRGYRFIGEVKREQGKEESAPAMVVVDETLEKVAATLADAAISSSQKAGSQRFWRAAAISVVVFLALAGAIYWITRPQPIPRIVASHVLTKMGTGTFLTGRGYFQGADFLTDRGSIYFQAETPSGRVTLQVSTAGGEPMGSLEVNGFLGDISRDGSELLFITRERDTCDVWEQSLPAGTPRLVIHDACSPRWSVDGKDIFFTRNNAKELYRAKADGTGVQRLATVPLIVNPHLSPDGSRIRFTGIPGYSMWEVGADGSNPHPIFAGYQDVFGGSWTPDAKYYYFTSWDGDRSSLWVVSEAYRWWKKSSTSVPQRLTFGPMSILAPAISKDGKQLYAVGIGRRGELSAYDSKAGKFTPYLGGESICFVDFSRDGQWMAYVTYPEGTLWRSRINGDERRQLAVPPMAVGNPRWSPDGKLIAFMDMSNGDRRKITYSPSRIYVVSADGGSPLLLLDGYFGDPTWSPDGRSIAYHYLRYPAAEVRILDLQSQNSTTVPGSQGFWSPRWSPDGKYLVALGGDQPRNPKLMLFSFERNAWEELAPCTDCNWPSWSHDSKFVYAHENGTDSLVRVSISNHNKQQVSSLLRFRATAYYWDRIGYYWLGLTPDDRPVTTRDTGIEEIYAFDLEYK